MMCHLFRNCNLSISRLANFVVRVLGYVTPDTGRTGWFLISKTTRGTASTSPGILSLQPYPGSFGLQGIKMCLKILNAIFLKLFSKFKIIPTKSSKPSWQDLSTMLIRLIKWKFPVTGRMKRNTGRAGFGGVFKDERGYWIIGFFWKATRKH